MQLKDLIIPTQLPSAAVVIEPTQDRAGEQQASMQQRESDTETEAETPCSLPPFSSLLAATNLNETEQHTDPQTFHSNTRLRQKILQHKVVPTTGPITRRRKANGSSYLISEIDPATLTINCKSERARLGQRKIFFCENTALTYKFFSDALSSGSTYAQIIVDKIEQTDKIAKSTPTEMSEANCEFGFIFITPIKVGAHREKSFSSYIAKLLANKKSIAELNNICTPVIKITKGEFSWIKLNLSRNKGTAWVTASSFLACTTPVSYTPRPLAACPVSAKEPEASFLPDNEPEVCSPPSKIHRTAANTPPQQSSATAKATTYCSTATLCTTFFSPNVTNPQHHQILYRFFIHMQHYHDDRFHLPCRMDGDIYIFPSTTLFQGNNAFKLSSQIYNTLDIQLQFALIHLIAYCALAENDPNKQKTENLLKKIWNLPSPAKDFFDALEKHPSIKALSLQGVISMAIKLGDMEYLLRNGYTQCDQKISIITISRYSVADGFVRLDNSQNTEVDESEIKLLLENFYNLIAHYEPTEKQNPTPVSY